MDELIGRLSQEFHVRPEHAQAVVELLDEGNTVPFIARYRKERHGAMDDQTIRELADRLAYLRGLEARKKEVKAAVEEQGKLTPELAAASPPEALGGAGLVEGRDFLLEIARRSEPTPPVRF